jgi:dTDP-4-dehydrorhamnose reductase
VTESTGHLESSRQTAEQAAEQTRRIGLAAAKAGEEVSRVSTIAASLTEIIDPGLADMPAAFDRAGRLVPSPIPARPAGMALQAIVEGLRKRGVTLKAKEVVPITTADYPTKAVRPANSRLDLTRLQTAYRVSPMACRGLEHDTLVAAGEQIRRRLGLSQPATSTGRIDFSFGKLSHDNVRRISL